MNCFAATLAIFWGKRIWSRVNWMPLSARRLPTRLDDYEEVVKGVLDPEHRMMVWDSLTYLLDDILQKVDRAAMGVRLETRVPFLDRRVAELAWCIPLHMKIRNGQGKWILRQVLYKYVPRELIDRPKAGFDIPLGDWLRGPLREWADNLLLDNALDRCGLLDTELVTKDGMSINQVVEIGHHPCGGF
jgi:asparagine synthase (glutamine-hydrolysing)